MAVMTPQQMRAFELSRYLNSLQSPTLTPEQFAALQNRTPYQTALSQQPDITKPLQSFAEQKGGDYLESLFSGGAVGSGAASGDSLSSLFNGSIPASSIPATGGTQFASGAMYAGEAVGTAANGGTLMSTGAVVPASEGGAVASVGGAEASTLGAYALPAAGALLGGLGLYDIYKNKRTGARGIGQGAASGAALGASIGSVVPVIGTGIGAAIGGLGGGIFGAMQHESTRDRAKRHTKELLGKNEDDPVYQAYVRGMREQYNSGPPDPSKPFYGGQYGSWEEYKKAGLDAGDLTGVFGNIKTFGKDWTGLNFDQQKAVTQGIIDAGLYNSKKGEVEISDPEQAKRIFQSMAQGGFKIPTKTPSAAPVISPPMAPSGSGGRWVDKNGNPVISIDPGFTIGNKFIPNAPAPVMIPRSKTASPGIGKDGRRISYGSSR